MSEQKSQTLDDTTSFIRALTKASCNIELMWFNDEAGYAGVFCRARPYGKSAPKDAMFIGYGPTALDALRECVAKINKGEANALDWKWRPGEYFVLSTDTTTTKVQQALPKAGGR